MVLLVSPWHSFEHTQYSTLGFTPKSQNRANVVAGKCQIRTLLQTTYRLKFFLFANRSIQVSRFSDI